MRCAIFLALVASAFGLTPQEEELFTYTCGGSGGNSQWSEEGYTQYGRITGFEIWHGSVTCVVDGIRLKYGDVWAPKRNNGGSKAKYEFHHDEFLTAVEMDKRTHWGFEVICQITIFTTRRAYGPFCNYQCTNNRCGAVQYGDFRYISGRSGGALDSLTWHL